MNEKDIKLTINKLWKEIKEMKLDNNAIYGMGIRTAQILALMKTIQREDIFLKADVEYIFSDVKQMKITEVNELKTEFRKGKIVPIPKQRQQETLYDIPELKVKPKV